MAPAWIGPQCAFLYFSDRGDLVILRYDPWEMVVAERWAEGFGVWQEPLTFLRLPKAMNLYSDPFERAQHRSIAYSRWRLEWAYLLVPAKAFVAQVLSSLSEHPPR